MKTPDETSMDQPLTVVAAVIERDGEMLIARRREGGIGGDWEFPGGQLHEGETPERGLERELAEELGVETRTGDLLCLVPFRADALSLDLLVYRSSLVNGTFTLNDHDELAWVLPSALDESIFSEPDRPVVRLLKTRRGKPGNQYGQCYPETG